jgi:hypothetical protein
MQQYESPIPYNDYSPVPSRFATTAPLPRELDSVPSSSTYRDYSRTSRFEGLDFSSSINDDRVQGRRQWGESAIGLPRARDPLDDRGLPFPRTTLHGDKQRAESVVGTTAERNLYSLLGGRIESALAQRFGERGAKSLASKRDSGSPNSRINLTPADSVSVVGMRSERAETVRKDPLEILKRIEAERSEHNRQWEVKRAESALGDRDIPRSISRFEHTPQHARPATSMSNLRDQHAAPRTAPAERQRRLLDEIDSPLRDRVSSRMSHVLYPSSEPRPMRSSTSLGGQAPVHLDPSSATTGHGRLLFEAFQSLATKLQSEMSGTVTSFYSATRTSESVNTSVHAALQLAAQISIEIEVDPALVRDQLARLIALLRETSRASDQNVRDQTGIMLDLPKALPAVNGSRMNNDIPRRWRPSSPSTYEYPIGRSAEMVRPATSIGDCCSPSKRFSRDVPEASMTASRDRLPSNMSPYISAVHGLASTPRRDELPPIEASPPVTFSSTQSHDHVPAPASPEQPRKVLRKKASTTSTNTVRGSTFLPSASKVRTTTAISVITAGDNSPSKARSISSQRSSLWDEHGQGEPSSPTSRFSFHTAESRDHDESDAVSLLAQAAKNRDVGKWGGAVGLGKAGGRGEGGNENGRRPSVSERFRATLRRNPGSEPA